MNRMLGLWFVVMISGCAVSEDGAVSVAAERNDLNVDRVEIRHQVLDGDRVLRVTGLDAAGGEVGSAILRTGMVRYNNESLDDAIVAGNELTLAVGEAKMTFVSPNRDPHKEIVSLAVLERFAHLSAVARALEDEAGITTGGLPTRPLDGTESSYSYSSTCDSNNFPSRLGGNSNCCWNTYSVGSGGYTIHKKPDGSGLALRGLYYACTNPDGTRCYAGDACWYGPCGGHPYTLASPNNSSGFAYIGHSDQYGYPMNCYGDSNGGSPGGGYENPMGVGGAGGMLILGTGYPVGASCPYNHCDANGNPTP